MNALSVYNISKSVKDDYLFSEVSFGLEAGEPREGGTTSVNQFKLTFDDGETTGIESLDNLTTSPFDGTGSIFDLQGCKADGSKLTKGIYIVNGKKVVIK